MKNKKDKDKAFTEFMSHILSLGFDPKKLELFFEWVSKDKYDPVCNDILKNIDGGVKKDWSGGVRSSIRTLKLRSAILRLRLERIWLKSARFECCTSSPEIEIEVLSTNNEIWERAICLYLSVVEDITLSSMSEMEKCDRAGKFIKFWRGALDTEGVTRLINEKKLSSFFYETDRFLRCLEKVHRETIKLLRGEKNLIHNIPSKKRKNK